jgi:hypothetical protein
MKVMEMQKRKAYSLAVFAAALSSLELVTCQFSKILKGQLKIIYIAAGPSPNPARVMPLSFKLKILI